jgi:hypothetical protein
MAFYLFRVRCQTVGRAWGEGSSPGTNLTSSITVLQLVWRRPGARRVHGGGRVESALYHRVSAGLFWLRPEPT